VVSVKPQIPLVSGILNPPTEKTNHLETLYYSEIHFQVTTNDTNKTGQMNMQQRKFMRPSDLIEFA
jgi:hypothetical protein